MHPPSLAVSWIAKASLRLTFSNSIKLYLCWRIKRYTRTPLKPWTEMRSNHLSSDHEKSAMPTSSSLEYVLAFNLLPQSKHLHFRLQSRFTSQKKTWPTSQENLALRRCSPKARINSNHTRNFTSPANHHPYTSCGPKYVLAAHVALKLSIWIRLRLKHFWIQLIPHLISSSEKRTSSLFTSNVWLANFCSATLNVPFLLTATVGEQDQIGRLFGKARHRLLRFSIHLSSLSSRASLKLGTWRAVF